MSIIGLVGFIGGVVVVAGSTHIIYQWFKRHTFHLDDDPSWRIYCMLVSMLLGVCVMAFCFLVLMLFLMLVFPDYMS